MASTQAAKRQKLGTSPSVSAYGTIETTTITDNDYIGQQRLTLVNSLDESKRETIESSIPSSNNTSTNTTSTATSTAATSRRQPPRRGTQTSASNGRLQHHTSSQSTSAKNSSSFILDADELSDDTDGNGDEDEVEDDDEEDEEDIDDDDEEEEEEEEEDEDEEDDDNSDDETWRSSNRHSNKNNNNGKRPKAAGKHRRNTSSNNNNLTKKSSISANSHLQEQLAASGPAGVAAAAAIATARKRRRPHTFETNPSVRKRQQTRLIRKLRACIDEYTARVGQQAVVLITMPGKTAHNFKVFGAQPLESVVRSCKQEIMSELEQAVAEQTPMKLQSGEDDSGKHELPPLVIDGIPTPVEKMTQAQLRAFIPLMLKYSTGRGKPGWGKESTKPQWWPNTLPWANVRSDARDEGEKQRISWTTTLREIVTNCYKFHAREDLLPSFDESEAALAAGEEGNNSNHDSNNHHYHHHQHSATSSAASNKQRQTLSASQRPLGSASTRSSRSSSQAHHQQQQQHHLEYQVYQQTQGQQQQQQQYTGQAQAQFVHTIQNSDGTVSLIQVDPANAQILTLPDGTQVRAVRLQTLADGSTEAVAAAAEGQHQLVTSLEGTGASIVSLSDEQHQQQQQHQHHQLHHQEGGEIILASQDAQHQLIGADGQQQTIILTNEDGTQSCYPVSQLVSIPASMYQQFATTGQPLSIVTADGTQLTATTLGGTSALQEGEGDGTTASAEGNLQQQQQLQEAQEISEAEAKLEASRQVQQIGQETNTRSGKSDETNKSSSSSSTAATTTTPRKAATRTTKLENGDDDSSSLF